MEIFIVERTDYKHDGDRPTQFCSLFDNYYKSVEDAVDGIDKIRKEYVSAAVKYIKSGEYPCHAEDYYAGCYSDVVDTRFRVLQFYPDKAFDVVETISFTPDDVECEVEKLIKDEKVS